MKIAVVGTGYVGLVAGACFAESGNDVTCVDIDEDKIRRLQNADVPIYEPGLERLIERNLAAERLAFTTDLRRAVRHAEVIFIAVGTPPDEDGSADLRHVLAVADEIGVAMDAEKIVVTKSTVPVGTACKVRDVIAARSPHAAYVCSNPEFLKEGNAVEDFMKPDRVVIGTDSNHAAHVLRELYAPFVRTGRSILMMDVASAEITKYASNAMLAMRISFMNTMASLCERVGGDVEAVRAGVGSDSRIGSSFLFAGIGYGGSCFGKDVRALARSLDRLDVDASIVDSVERVNESQKRALLARLTRRLGDDLRGQPIAIWGLSFKPETDDMRDAPSLVTIDGLLARGADIVAHDPAAVDEARRRFGDRIRYAPSNYKAIEGARALVIHTEWHPYRHPDFVRMRRAMAEPLIFDGRNLYDPRTVASHGFEYHCIGRAPTGGSDGRVTAKGRFLLPPRSRPEPAAGLAS